MNKKFLLSLIKQAVKTEDKKKKEEKEVTRLVSPSPDKKPPRRDKKRTIIKDSDPDLSTKDPDMSLNYKDVGGSLKKKGDKILPPEEGREQYAIDVDGKRLYFETEEEAQTYLDDKKREEDKEKVRDIKTQESEIDRDVRQQAEKDFKYVVEQKELDDQVKGTDPEYQTLPQPISEMLSSKDFDPSSINEEELVDKFRLLSQDQLGILELELSQSKLTMSDLAAGESSLSDKNLKTMDMLNKALRTVKRDKLPTVKSSEDLEALVKENSDDPSIISRVVMNLPAKDLYTIYQDAKSPEALEHVVQELKHRSVESFKSANNFLKSLQDNSLLNPAEFNLNTEEGANALLNTVKKFSDKDLMLAVKNNPTFRYILDIQKDDYEDIDDYEDNDSIFDPKRRDKILELLKEDLERDQVRRKALNSPKDSFNVKDDDITSLLSKGKEKSLFDLLFGKFLNTKKSMKIMKKRAEYRGEPGPLFFYDTKEEDGSLSIARPSGVVPYPREFKPSRISRDLEFKDFLSILYGAYDIYKTEPACIGVPEATGVRIALDMYIWNAPANYQASVDAPTYKALYDLLCLVAMNRLPIVSENIGQTL